MKKAWAIFLTLILVLSLLPGITVSADSTDNSDIVSETTAKDVAQYYVNGYSKIIPAWENGTVSEPIAYYSDDDILSAYEFTVVKDNQDAGFIVISARKDWMPVLEFGDGKAPSKYLPKAVEAAEANSFISSGDSFSPKHYYNGAASYAVQIGDKMKKENKLISLTNFKLFDKPAKAELSMDKQISRNAWDELLAGFKFGSSPTQLLENTDMESGDPPNNWALEGAGASYSRSSAQHYNGQYSLVFTRNGDDCDTYQAVSNFSYYHDRKLTLKAYIWASQANCASISISDGVSTISSPYHTGNSTWKLLQVDIYGAGLYAGPAASGCTA